jgi:putative hydrolase of the HAD superfamily
MILSDSIYNGKVEIKNIIFDWGGVITNLHFEAAKNAFRELGLKIFDDWAPMKASDEIFYPLETGKISPEEFRNRLRIFSNRDLTDEMIDNAWNSMLGELPADRWRLLESVGKKYRTFLLSNTNTIHLDYYFNYLKALYGSEGYTHLFEKTYFSFKLGLRKPDREIFEYVIHDTGIDPAETLFIDDFVENIDTAHKLGFQAYHLQPPFSLTDLFVSDIKLPTA